MGLVFSAVFDPVKKAAMEQLDRQKSLQKADEAGDTYPSFKWRNTRKSVRHFC